MAGMKLCPSRKTHGDPHQVATTTESGSRHSGERSRSRDGLWMVPASASAQRQHAVRAYLDGCLMPDDIENLLRRLIGGDDAAATEILARAGTAAAPALLVAAALLTDEHGQHRALLARAADSATTTRDRQLVAVAAAHLGGDEDLLDALVRDHLSDYPDNILAAWIAAKHTRPAHIVPFTS